MIYPQSSRTANRATSFLSPPAQRFCFKYIFKVPRLADLTAAGR